MYTYFWRLTPHPFLRLFDAPDTTSACTRRIRTNTPLQALTLLNDPTFTECAAALADRLLKEVPAGDRERIRHAFRLTLEREPTQEEVRKVEHYLTDQRSLAGRGSVPRPAAAAGGGSVPRPAPTPSEWLGLARALLNLDEFITRE
jgi:hypothetical protein